MLNDIKGIGKKTEEQLIRHFKSVENIRKASLAELAAAIGVSKAKIVCEFFNGVITPKEYKHFREILDTWQDKSTNTLIIKHIK